MTRKFVLLLLLLLGFRGTSQEIVRQKPLDNIDQVLFSKTGDHLLVRSGTSFTLIETKSRLQLGSMDIQYGSNTYPHQGKTRFLNDHRFVVNTLQELLLVDILEQKIDTLGLNNEFPEMIENFHLLPGDEPQLLIATKLYPMDKEGTISFVEFNGKGEPRYDDSKNCRLYVFDYVQDSIVSRAEIPHSLTAISDNGAEVFAGTFEGKILRIGSDLRPTELFRAFEEPVFWLQNSGNRFVAIPHLEKQVLHDLGKGELLVFESDGRLAEKIALEPQDFPGEQDSFFQVLPSNLVMAAFPDKDGSGLFVNYGFNKLLKYDPVTGRREELSVDRKFADFHQLSPDGSQLLVAAADEKPTFSQPSGLEVYDLEQQKHIALFSDADPALKFEELKKIYSGGNYYYYGKPDAYSDYSVLYPSHQTRPLFLKNHGSSMDLDEEGNLLMVTGNRVTFGPLELSGIRKDSLHLDYGYRPELDDMPRELFHPYFDSRQWENELPFGITKVSKVGQQHFLAMGYNEELSNYYLVFDAQGKLLFQRDGLEEAVWNQKDNLSTSGRFLALDYKKRNKAYLEVWDWAADKLIFEAKYDEDLWWSYRFDEQEDVLLLRLTDEHGYTSIEELDLGQAEPAPVTLIDRIATVDFAMDRERGLLAIDNKTGFSILDLKTREQLWSVRTPADASIRQLEQGFGFGSEEEYYTVNTADFSSVYFTSFEGHQPIEISSSLYYSGEKNAIKNIAIVAENRGYLPSDYDLFLNRPDLVLESSGSTNTAYHELIGKAVAKRTEELPTTDFSEFLKQRPELQIAGREDLPTYTSAKQESLKFGLSSSSSASLSSYQVLVNGVPLYGKEGKQIAEGGKLFEAEVSLPLSRGANSIQIFGTDSRGFISNKEVVNIHADYQESPRVHLVLISADTYDDSDYNLKYSVKDARDLAASLSRRYGSSLVVDSLFNSDITPGNLERLKEKLSKVSVNDRVILFLSGHGVLDSQLEFRFATPDMDFGNIDEHGISNSRIESLLLNSPSREKLLLIDACHSGEFDREEYDTAVAEAAGVRRYEGRKGAIATSVRSSNATFELMNQLFTDVAVSTGIRVISAAAGDSYALESETWNNGVFTYALLSTLEEEQHISVSELKESTYSKVVNLTGGNQQPTSRGESIEFEFEL